MITIRHVNDLLRAIGSIAKTLEEILKEMRLARQDKNKKGNLEG